MFRTLLAAALTLAFASSASAAPINTLTLVYGNSNVPNAQTLNLFNGAVGAATPPQPAAIDVFGSIQLGAYTASPMTIDTTPFNTNPGLVNVTPTLTITGTLSSGPGQAGGDNGKTATFTFIGGILNVFEGGLADSVSGFVQLTALSAAFTGIDFGSIGTIFHFAGSFQGTTFTPGTPGSVSGAPNSSSFTLTRVSAVPEPATLATLGLMGLCGGYFARRKLKAGSVAQA